MKKISEKRIDKRIEELEKKIQGHQKMVFESQQAINKLKTAIVSKSGAVIELKELLKIDKT